MQAQSVFKRWLWFMLAALVTSSLYLPLRYAMPYPLPLGPQFTPNIKREYVDAIRQRGPRLVLIGDSVLYLGVDESQLSSDLGMPLYSLGVPGSGSAVWYLILKNLVIDAVPRPKYVVVLFRDSMLTAPAYRTTGRYFGLVDDFATRNEPLVAQLAFINQLNPVERITEQYVPLFGARTKLRDGLDSRMRYSASSYVLKCSEQCTDDALNSIFGKQRVDAAAMNQAVEDAGQILYSDAALNFPRQLSRSFLPAMIELAHENGITLIFVRTKTRLFPAAASEPAVLKKYVDSLAAYLATQDGVSYIDFAHDARIRDSDFLDGLHFNAQGKERFTELLAAELQSILK